MNSCMGWRLRATNSRRLATNSEEGAALSPPDKGAASATIYLQFPIQARGPKAPGKVGRGDDDHQAGHRKNRCRTPMQPTTAWFHTSSLLLPSSLHRLGGEGREQERQFLVSRDDFQ